MLSSSLAKAKPHAVLGPKATIPLRQARQDGFAFSRAQNLRHSADTQAEPWILSTVGQAQEVGAIMEAHLVQSKPLSGASSGSSRSVRLRSEPSFECGQDHPRRGRLVQRIEVHTRRAAQK